MSPAIQTASQPATHVHGYAYTDAITAQTRYFHAGCAEAWGFAPPGFRFRTFADRAVREGHAFIGRRGTLEPLTEWPHHPIYPIKCANCKHQMADGAWGLPPVNRVR